MIFLLITYWIMGGFYMLKKLLICFIAYVCGLLTIAFFPPTNEDNLSLFISHLIINPFRFFLGTIAFMVTTSALSTMFSSLFEQTYKWLIKKQSFTATLAIDFVSLLCYFFLIKKSLLITMLLLIFALFYGAITADLHDDAADKGDSLP